MFFIREPVSRYISAFNSRLRKGYPRHAGEWTPREEIAFANFQTPNQLAEALSATDDERREQAEFAMGCIRHVRNGYESYLGWVELLEQEIDRIYFIGATETFESDFGLMRKFLGVSPELEVPQDDYGAHRTPDTYEKTITELGARMSRDYYKADYEIYNWCVKRREELIALRSAGNRRLNACQDRTHDLSLPRKAGDLSQPKTGTTALDNALSSRASIAVHNPPSMKHMQYHKFMSFVAPWIRAQAGLARSEYESCPSCASLWTGWAVGIATAPARR